jgi:hypothetical protein
MVAEAKGRVAEEQFRVDDFSQFGGQGEEAVRFGGGRGRERVFGEDARVPLGGVERHVGAVEGVVVVVVVAVQHHMVDLVHIHGQIVHGVAWAGGERRRRRVGGAEGSVQTRTAESRRRGLSETCAGRVEEWEGGEGGVCGGVRGQPELPQATLRLAGVGSIVWRLLQHVETREKRAARGERRNEAWTSG